VNDAILLAKASLLDLGVDVTDRLRAVASAR
jgi:hypothetical protein